MRLSRLLPLTLLVALAAAPSASGAVGTSLYATGLHISTGSITAPDGRTWVSDHNAGFCRIVDPTAAAPGHIEHPDFDPATPNTPTDTPTCLGGLLAGAAPGPDASSAPAFFDPTPGSPNSGDEKVFVPDGAAPSSEVYILGWHPDTHLFTNDGVVNMDADPNRSTRSRPLAASLGPDGFVYVGFQSSGTIQRFDPALAQPTAQLVGSTADARGVGGVAAGFDSAGQTTVYAAERTGVRQFKPGGNGTATSQAVPFTATAPNAMAYDRTRHLLYLGTANGVTAADAGTDLVQRVATNSNSTETYATGFSMVGGLDVRADGAVVVVDDDALLDPAEPIGNGKMYVAGLPAARIASGPTSADGSPAADREFTNDSTPTFTVSGDPGLECSLTPAGADPVWAPCPADGTFTAPSALADGGYFFSTRATNAAGTGIPTGHAFTVDTAAPGAPSVLAPSAGATVDGTPDFAFGGEPGASFACSLDDGPFSACEPGPTFAFAASGAHALRIQNVDRAGNVSAPSAPSPFIVDVIAPDVTIDSPSDSALTGRSPQFAYHANEAGARFRCRLDNGPVEACGSSKGFKNVAPGTHTFQVGATDAVGNVGPLASRKIRVSAGKAGVDDGSGTAAELSAESLGLRLGALTVHRTVTRAALERGLRLGVKPAKGTKLVRVRLLRGRQVVVTRWLKVRGTRRQTLVLRGKAIAGLRTGAYRIDVTPGTSRTKLGATTSRSFRVLR